MNPPFAIGQLVVCVRRKWFPVNDSFIKDKVPPRYGEIYSITDCFYLPMWHHSKASSWWVKVAGFEDHYAARGFQPIEDYQKEAQEKVPQEVKA